MKDLALEALGAATAPGVSYADVRVQELRERSVATKNGKVGHVSSSVSLGIGIRVLAHGCWGFAATDDLSREGLARAAAQALEIARAGTLAHERDVVLAPEEKYEAVWVSPCAADPFATSVDQNLDLLLAVDRELRRNQGVSLAEASLTFERRRQVFASTLGSLIDQTRTVTGAGFSALSYRDGEIQKRSYPNSFGGQYQLKGYELVEELRMLEHAPRIAEEAVALHSADQCPEGEFDLILDSSQLGLQIHESIGHPIELDRVLGSEANYAGMSFLTLDQLYRLQYGAEIVNVVCDARLEHGPGLGTFAFDDEGVPAQRTDIIRGGRFTGYMTSRETAPLIGQTRSNGTMRADGWARAPLIRMTNVSLLPGEQSLEEVFGGTDHAIYMETNRSWSIDDKRYQFQFGCEIGWEIRNGRRTRMLKNPSYSGISTEFWNACAAIAGPEHWTLWGTPNCGKGQPEQVMGTGHGASPARFRRIRVGSAYGG
ncbi:MAG TPA: TldD/PmbA family protein [Bryobacteraceae bacterium]|nr:TldD/PmbA family protein [Bryobacteraceae bacterium]